MKKIWKVWIVFGIAITVVFGGIALSNIKIELPEITLPEINLTAPNQQITVTIDDVIGNKNGKVYKLHALTDSRIEISKNIDNSIYSILGYALYHGNEINLDNGVAILKIVNYGSNWVTFELIRG